MLKERYILSCGFKTFHVYRWCDKPAGAKKLSTTFLEGFLSSCSQDQATVRILREIVSRTSASFPTQTTEDVIQSARKALEQGSWVIVRKEDDIPDIAVPAGVSVDANIRAASATRFHMKDSSWFYEKVRNRGDWDYKQRGAQFQNFGNFNYGASGTAFGFSEDTLLRMAGWAQVQAGTSQPEWGEAPNKLQAYLGVGGRVPFGDDPNDRYWIQQGIAYYRNARSCR